MEAKPLKANGLRICKIEPAVHGNFAVRMNPPAS